MPKLNENYQNVKDSYLFAEIARRVKVYEETHPEKAADIIRLGIGDVTLPLTKSVIEALHEAVDSQAVSETFKGYGPEQGYAFAQEAIADYYARNGVESKSYRYSLFQMAQRVIQEILQSFLQRITWFSFRIRFTLFM